jgi:hypothetical protein
MEVQGYSWEESMGIRERRRGILLLGLLGGSRVRLVGRGQTVPEGGAW